MRYPSRTALGDRPSDTGTSCWWRSSLRVIGGDGTYARARGTETLQQTRFPAQAFVTFDLRLP